MRRQGTRPTQWRAWLREERGSVAAEITLVTPFLVILLVFVAVVIHRGVDARLRLDDAAHEAARAASLARSAAAAEGRAQTTAEHALAAAGVACRPMRVDTDTANFAPGGTVVVTVACTVDLEDALVLGIPASKTLSASASEPIDTWRGATAGGPG